MTLGALFIMYMCVYMRSWVALLLAGSSVRDLQLKAILPAVRPICFRGNRCILEAIAE